MKSLLSCLVAPSFLLLSCEEENPEPSSPETPAPERIQTRSKQTRPKQKTKDRVEDLYFTISLEGGPFDGKSFTGKVDDITARVTADTHKGSSSVTFTKIPLPGSSYTANFGITWQGDINDGQKTQHFDGNGSAETGKSGHLNLFNSDPNGEFSRLQIQFKETALEIHETSRWEDTSTKIHQRKYFSGKGAVSKTITKFYKGNKLVTDSKSEEITLKFSFSAKASRLK